MHEFSVSKHNVKRQPLFKVLITLLFFQEFYAILIIEGWRWSLLNYYRKYLFMFDYSKIKQNIGSKADYIPKTLGQAREDFICRAKASVVALREDKVRPYHPAPMVRQQKKTRMYCVKIGYGGNNAYMPNPVHKASQVLKYATAGEAASDIESIIIRAAETGQFDDGLSAVLEQHRKLAKHRKAVMSASNMAHAELSGGYSAAVEAQAAD